MKRSADNFLTLTNNGYTPNTGLITGNDLNNGSNLLVTVPEEVFICIFSTEVYAKKDILWQGIAEAILFLYEIESKPKERGYKEHCKALLSLTDLGPIVPSHHCFLKPRDPDFINSLKQMKLPDYKILSPSETWALIEMKDSKQLIEAVLNNISEHDFSFHHVAQQQVGTIKFDMFNCTPYVISLNSERKMLINNKLTSLDLTPVACQLLILFSDDNTLRIYNSDIGYDLIVREDLAGFNDLMLDDPSLLRRETYFISKISA